MSKSFIIKSSGGGSNFDPAPAGNQVARLIKIIDLGTSDTNFKNKDGSVKKRHELSLVWELPLALMTDGRPFVVSRRFTSDLNEKSNLSAILESWRGRDFTDAERKAFDISTILGKVCFANIKHVESKGRVYANVDAITPLAAGVEAPAAINPTLLFSLSDFDQDAFDKLGGYQKTVEQSYEYKALFDSGHHAAMAELDADIPF